MRSQMDLRYLCAFALLVGFATLPSDAKSINPILYGLSLFQSDSGTPALPTYQQQFEAMKNSGFETLVLWSFHVSKTGDISYNDSPCVVNGTFQISTNGDKGMNPNYTEYINTIKSYGSVKKIYVSIGWGLPVDYDNFMANQQVATNNFKVLLEQLPAIDGFDFDYEAAFDPNVMLTMTKLLGVDLNKSITFCPYVDESPASHARARGFWLPILQTLYKTYNYQPVDWFNLQCYAGGAYNQPAQWVQAIEQYPGGAEKVLGVKDPAAFIAPGYWVNSNESQNGMCPPQIETTFAALKDSNISAGFLWNSEDLFRGQAQKICGDNTDSSPKAYATAILNGLSNE